MIKKRDKKTTKKMFNDIAKRYDFLNHCLSFGMDYYWRRKAIQYLTNNPKNILDIATGTADFAITASSLKNVKITGVDISEEMLKIGKKKIKDKGLEKIISLYIADAEKLPFNDNCFDAITAGFGIRNFENLNLGLSEIYRTLKTGGILVILEPSEPKHFLLNKIYKVYFHHILPFIGKIVSKNKNAYDYLPNSVKSFPSGNNFLNYLKKSGFKNCKHIPLTFGIVNLYTAIK